MTGKQIFLSISLVLILSVAGTFLLLSESRSPDTPENTRPTSTILGEEYEKFTHTEHGFSLEYPKELSVTRFEESLPEGVEGETIVFQHPDDTAETAVEAKTGFQVFIVPFETKVGQPAQLTEERIRQDLPSTDIIDPKPVIINPDVSESEQIEGLLFWSTDGRGNRTREVWFIHQGNLYEITTYEHLDTWLAQILSSWRLQ